ncbi:MAG: hypothetical protein QXX94_04585 [Candidatus Bathyarchaeia archaeon]
MVIPLEINIKPTRRVIILGLDRRELENLGFCAITFGASRLFWVNGYVLCLEVYEKSLECEIEGGEFYISHLCYAPLPKYNKILEVERGTQIPIVNASDMQIYREIINAILKFELEKEARE